MTVVFNFSGYKTAFSTSDAEAWISYYAPDAEWIEYRHFNPPRSPNIMAGIQKINEHIRGVSASRLKIKIEDEVIGPDRAAFRVWIILGDGRQIIEHVFIYYSNGKINRQVDVEAWD